MQQAVDAVLDCATTLSMAILVPARDTVMQYTWNRVTALRPPMVTELSFAALVVATKFCSINAPVEVGATTMPDCSSYGDAAQYTVPRSLSFVFTVMLVLVELNVWDTMDGAGSKSLKARLSRRTPEANPELPGQALLTHGEMLKGLTAKLLIAKGAQCETAEQGSAQFTHSDGTPAPATHLLTTHLWSEHWNDFIAPVALFVSVKALSSWLATVALSQRRVDTPPLSDCCTVRAIDMGRYKYLEVDKSPFNKLCQSEQLP
mmetsp:Transcript_19278/g.33358  ORF Transcript_19278/g.33358 Transcript_19278/m.33358 type:complete len:261 (+) Transcript_19278:158-940(+)